jgi:hypothetical protein
VVAFGINFTCTTAPVVYNNVFSATGSCGSRKVQRFLFFSE